MKVPGVRQVVVEQTWEPGWSSNQLTDEGRRKFGLL
jgi:metal-sulfur cluster biosynthetic enzyme